MSRRPLANDDTEQSFLRRWSRRKARAKEPAETGPPREASRPADQDQEPVEDPGRAAEPGPQERVKTDADMPDLDSIDGATNMSDFFSPGVSEELRNQALRRLFRLPKFNVVDGLDDYADNYRNFAPLGDVVTADMRHRMEMEQRRERRLAEAEKEASAPGTETAAAHDDRDAAEGAPAEQPPDQPAESADTNEEAGDNDSEGLDTSSKEKA